MTSSTADKFKNDRYIYSLFGDGGHDLFKYGLQELTPIIENPYSEDPNIRNTRLSLFNETPDYYIGGPSNIAAKEDPVMFGFDIIIRANQSPLFSNVLKDSVKNFLDSESAKNNNELIHRKKIWEDFKKNFFQFFRSDILEHRSINSNENGNDDNPSNSRFYYYLKKVSGLNSLIEANNGESYKQFVDYGKDKITLEFYEDVTLRVGRMANLYKNLYWSRINGKTLIPENLLRFDCDIIISEVRNFAKVKKILNKENIGKEELQIVRDNINRYVYTLYECQLFFDKVGHPEDINLSEPPNVFESFSVGFTYKFSTLRMDVFNPISDKYDVINNAMYNPYEITNFDMYLNKKQTIDQENNKINKVEPGKIPNIIIKTISLDDEKIPDYVYKLKKTITEGEIIQFFNSNRKIEYNLPSENESNSLSFNIMNNPPLNQPVTDYRWGRPDNINKKVKGEINKDYEFFKDNPYGIINSSSNISNEEIKLKILTKELNSYENNLPKESWLNSDTPVAKFVKRIANAGIQAANQIIASKVGLINKALNEAAGGILGKYNAIGAPINIYEQNFNGDLYLSSKFVKNALNKYVSESISELFKKK